MHINPLFICSLVAESCYVRFDEHGMLVNVPLYLATGSLLPISDVAAQVFAGGTWWDLGVADTKVLDSFATARSRGAQAVVVSPATYTKIVALEPQARINLEVIVVPDTQQALYAVAAAWRSQCIVPIIAVTGSIGKTTTIDMLAAIFNVDRLPVLIVTAQADSILGLALHLLHITDKHVAAVFEVGVMYTGAMRLCADLLRPTIAIITAICPAHLDATGTLQLVAQEKQEIFSFFSPSQVGVVCGDYPTLISHFYEHPIVRFGLKNKNTITARKVTLFKDEHGAIKTRLGLRVYDYEREVVLPGHHKALVYGALAAAALAHFLYIPFEVVVKGLSSYMPLAGGFYHRSLRDGRGMLMQDMHSISPDSVKASLHAMHAVGNPQSRKIAVLGNIPDLGDRTTFWHRHVGRELIKTRSISDIVLVGDATRPIRAVAPATMNVWLAPEWSDAQKQLQELLAPVNNVVLISGAVPYSINALVSQLT